jgi:hypothetical protein
MLKRYWLRELEAMPTLAAGQDADLKVETPDTRVWVGRCGLADGEPYEHPIYIEELINGRWFVVSELDGDQSYAEVYTEETS